MRVGPDSPCEDFLPGLEVLIGSKSCWLAEADWTNSGGRKRSKLPRRRHFELAAEPRRFWR